MKDLKDIKDMSKFEFKLRFWKKFYINMIINIMLVIVLLYVRYMSHSILSLVAYVSLIWILLYNITKGMVIYNMNKYWIKNKK